MTLTRKELIAIGDVPGSTAWQAMEVEELLSMPVEHRRRRVVRPPKRLPKNPQGLNKPTNLRGK